MFLYNFYSCSSESCNSETLTAAEKVKCETNSECSLENIDCGFGICEINISNTGKKEYFCNCDYGYLKKHLENGSETCILNECSSSADCLNTEIFDGYSYPTPFCSSEGKCTEY